MATMWAAKSGSSLRATVERSAAGSGLDGDATSKILGALRRLAPSGNVREDAFLLVLQELGVTGVAARRLFRRFDAPPRGQGTGTVSATTLVEGLAVLRRGGDDALRLVFECWDSDGDGRITLDELGTIVLGFASGAPERRRRPRARRRAAGAARGASRSRSSSADSHDAAASGAGGGVTERRGEAGVAAADATRPSKPALSTSQGVASAAASGDDSPSASSRDDTEARPPVASARAATHSGARAADERTAALGDDALAAAAAGSAAEAARAVGLLWNEESQCGPTDLVSRFPTADVEHLDEAVAVLPSELARSRVLASSAAGRRLRQAQSAELESAIGSAADAGAAAGSPEDGTGATPLKAASLALHPAGLFFAGRPGSPSALRAPTDSPFHGLGRLGDASDALPPHRDGAEPLRPPQATLSRTDTEAEWVAARAVVRERLGGASLIRDRPLEPASTPLAASREAGRMHFDMPSSPASASAQAAACAAATSPGLGEQQGDDEFGAATGVLDDEDELQNTEDSEASDRSSLAHGPPAPGEEFRVRRRRRRRPSLNIIAASQGDEQAGHLRDLFAAIDVNQDGTIEFSEFKDAIRSHPCLVEAFLRPMDGLGGSYHQWLLDLHS